VVVIYLCNEKQNGRTTLRCAIYPNAGFPRKLVELFSIGQEKGRWPSCCEGCWPIGLTGLDPPFVLSKLHFICLLNLLNC